MAFFYSVIFGINTGPSFAKWSSYLIFLQHFWGAWMEQIVLRMKYFIVVLFCFPIISYAVPVEIVLTGFLDAQGGDRDNFDGAFVRLSYTGDSGDEPSGGYHTPGGYKNIFYLSLSLEISGRPDGFSNQYGEWANYSTEVINKFSSSSENDGLSFTRAIGGGVLLDEALDIQNWGLDFGANIIFPDRDSSPRSTYPPDDLSFLLGMPRDFTPYLTTLPELRVLSSYPSVYRISNLTVANVYGLSAIPIPASFYLFVSGILGLLGFSKQTK